MKKIRIRNGKNSDPGSGINIQDISNIGNKILFFSVSDDLESADSERVLPGLHAQL
jgi:hypothetical protein